MNLLYSLLSHQVYYEPPVGVQHHEVEYFCLRLLHRHQQILTPEQISFRAKINDDIYMYTYTRCHTKNFL